MAEAKVNPRNRIKGHVGHLSKELKNWEGAIQLAQSNKTDFALNRMRELQRKCEGILDLCRSLTLDLNDLEPDTTADNDKTVKNWEDKYDKVYGDFMSAEQTLTSADPHVPVLSTGASRPSKAIRPKPNDPMSPTPLAPDAKPAILRAWKKRYKIYYESHHMEDMPIEEQQAYFLSCLTPTLEARMNSVITQSNHVLPKPNEVVKSCFQLLEDEFLLTYPLVNRRHDFFVCSQSNNQKLTDFILNLRKLSEEADLEKLSPDQLILFRALAGTQNQEFRQEFLRRDTHTLESLEKLARSF